MTATELRAADALAAVYFLRMFGLFLILPVFSLAARDLAGATPMLIGIALGAYGITQALLQIPFGMLSDRIGRRPVITIGLIIFAAGSVVAAMSDTITGVIVGRVLQGSGAIAAAVMALAADLTREEQRTKTMAIIGVSIGLAFITAFIVGPLLSSHTGLPGLFWISAVLAMAALGTLYLAVPGTDQRQFHPDCQSVVTDLPAIFAHPHLLRLNLGILILHAILTASFVALPLVLNDSAGLALGDHWKVYLPVLIGSVLFMVPLIYWAERHRRSKPALLVAIVLLVVSEIGLWYHADTLPGLVLAMLGFFTAFNFLEASLPSMVSRTAPADRRGTAMGAFTTSQFIGAFVGGLGGGWVYARFELDVVFLLCATLAAAWLLIAVGMTPPRHLKNRLLNVGVCSEGEGRRLQGRLAAVPGVTEVVVDPNGGVAYLKVDPDRLEVQALNDFAIAR